MLAIPAPNDEKYNWNNSAGQGLKQFVSLYCHNNNYPFVNPTGKLDFLPTVNKVTVGGAPVPLNT